MSKSNLIAAELVIIFAGLSHAQGPIFGHVSVQPFQYGQPEGVTNDLEEIVGHLDRDRLHRVVPGSWECQILKAGQESSHVVLQLTLGDCSRAEAYTLQTKEGDTLVARWDFASATRRERAVWLWDTPDYTTFVVEVDPVAMQANEFVRYSETLLVWEKDPLQLKSLKIAFLEPTGRFERAVGLGEYVTTQLGTYVLRFGAISNKITAYVKVELSKPVLIDKYPPEAYRVKERFPPLRSRLVDVPRHELFREIGQGYVAPRIATYPTNRDAIILNELLSRGPLSDVEVRQAVFGDLDRAGDVLAIHQRIIAFLQAVERQKQLGAYAAGLEKLFLRDRLGGWGWELVLGRVFSAMEENDVDFSGAAVRLAEQNQFTRQSLQYLLRNARDEEVLRRLASLAVKPEFEKDRSAAFEAINRRIHKASDPP